MTGSMAFVIIGCVLLLLYGMLVLACCLGFIDLPRKNSHEGESEQVAIIVPYRNEMPDLESHLKQMVAHAQAGSVVLVYVNDHSDDGSFELVTNFSSDFPDKIVCADSKGEGKKRAIESGIAISNGDLILTTDADALPESPNWVKSMISFFLGTGCQMVIGPVKISSANKSFIQNFQSLEQAGLTIITGGSVALGFPFLASGANLAFRRNAFNKLGGYVSGQNEPSGDDVFLLQDFKSRFGAKAIAFSMNPDSIVVTHAEKSWQGLLHQKVRWSGKVFRSGNNLTRSIGLLSLALPLWFILGGVLSVFFGGLTKYCLLFLIARALIDFLLLFLGTSFTGQRKSLWWFLPAFLFNQFYTVWVGIAAMFFRPVWKGRKV